MFRPGGQLACLALGRNNLQDIQRDDRKGVITGIAFQKIDTGRVKPVLPTDMFSRVNWPNSPVNLARQQVPNREYIDLDDPALAVAAPVRAQWEDFANTVNQTRDALLRLVCKYNNKLDPFMATNFYELFVTCVVICVKKCFYCPLDQPYF